ncbi:transposase [Tessaracoccus defluvii]|uniref:Transposase n=1 Tax=Tessaracoccus defluvii TaxID=1285901 RepID=A0A7H0H6A0_9ACTN|nr:transposase [Tessaracoccus defluvii]
MTCLPPLPASSGNTTRHRLNRGGDRRLNKAIHTIMLTRWRGHPETRAYIERRRAEGLPTRHIQRCLKRAIARRVFNLLNT